VTEARDTRQAELVAAVLAGQRRAIARMLTLVENGRPGKDAALAALFPHTGKAAIIGVTGAPGTGKSTLVNALARHYRQAGRTVGIIAVDPTSPFSGGAILGDRIRMSDHSGDPGVFIRSMATRGSLGGLAHATRDAVRVLDAAGFDIVLVETVGAGQSEVDIARTATTTLVVEAPGLGDDVQAIKAGILEIADVLVVNKADRPGATQTQRALKAMLELGHPGDRLAFFAHDSQLPLSVQSPHANGGANPEDTMWQPPVIATVSVEGKGIAELAEAIAAHRQYLEHSGSAARWQQHIIAQELIERMRDVLVAREIAQIEPDRLRAIVAEVQARRLDPNAAVHVLLEQP